MLKFDPNKFKAPHHPLDFIRQKADDFRNTYWPSGDLPINMYNIIEFGLELEIRPILGVRATTECDALLLGDFKGIIVDKDDYMNDRMENRMRFSLAHEIGHLLLHRNIYDGLPYSTPEEWREVMKAIPEEEYFWIEQHAYEFAGRLLVPVESLGKDFYEAIKFAESIGFTKWNARDKDQNEIAKDYISSRISKKYGVSYQVIARRLGKEGFWPPPK